MKRPFVDNSIARSILQCLKYSWSDNALWQVIVRKDFRVLKGVVYKSGQVPSMLIDIAGKKKWDGKNNISDDEASRETELSEPCNRTTSNESSLLGSVSILST